MATIDFLFIANHAEVQNGLLYASGVGWSDLHRYPAVEGHLPLHHFAVGTSILVPWEETNQPHRLIIRIEQGEGGTELSRVEIDVEVGRPPGLPAGTEQRAVFGVGVNVVFPAEGGYRVVAEVDEDTRSVGFRVHDVTSPQF